MRKGLLLAVVCLALVPAGAQAADDWSPMPAPNPTTTYGDLNGVACSSASACTAVGIGTTNLGAGGSTPLIERWDGSAWTVQAAPLPNGMTSVTLRGVSCPAATACMAVGNASGSSSGGMVAYRWDGSAWTPTMIADPPSTSETNLFAVSCVSTSDCTAAGSYSNSSYDEGVVLEHWDGNAWSPQTAPSLPSGSSGLSVTGVACVPGNASPLCTVVGTYNDPVSGTIPLVDGENWPGASGWQEQTPPLPSQGDIGGLKSVACPSATDCFAIGTYYDPNTFENGTLAEHWDGSAWSIQSAPSIWTPSGGSDFNGLSCDSASSCTAVGYQGYSMFVLHGNGTTWDNQDTATAATGQGGGYLGGVSCAPGAPHHECTAVGFRYDGAQYGGAQINQALAIQWDGSAWASSGPVTPPGGLGADELSSVSCASVNACAAVGDEAGVSWALPVVEMWDGTSWTLRHAPAPTTDGGWTGSRLTSVSCASSSACTAVGYSSYNSAVGQPLIEHWSGTNWSMDAANSIPAPTNGNSPMLDAVSCWSATDCVAVGTYFATSGANLLAETWNGSSWSAHQLPAPANAPQNGQIAIDAISCRSDSGTPTCMAVGDYYYQDQNTFATYDAPFAERWDGSSWTVESVPMPANANIADLYGVSCPAASTCIAVGRTVDQTTRVGSPLAETWSGGSWALGSAAVPASSNLSELRSVSCTSTTACTAVGQDITNSNSVTEGWNGTTWAMQTPDPGTAGVLFGVSCPSAGACIATGAGADGHDLIESDGITSSTTKVLRVSMAGSGTGTITGRGIDCSAHDMCTDTYGSGASVTLTATPDAHTHFVGWSGGGCSGTGTCTVTLSADTDVTATFTADTDVIAPSITITTPGDGQNYPLNSVVHADYSCSDEQGGSGVASCTGPVANGSAIDTSSPGQHSFRVDTSDHAGNTDSKTVTYYVQPDVTSPEITLNVPVADGHVKQNAVVQAVYSCTDQGGSGLASCSGTVANGSPIDTSTIGTHNFTVRASDNAGNPASVTVEYFVDAPSTGTGAGSGGGSSGGTATTPLPGSAGAPGTSSPGGTGAPLGSSVMSALQALAAPTGSNDSAGQIEKAGGITGSVDCTSSAPSPPPSPPCGVNDTVSAGGPTGTGAAHAAKKPVVVAQVKKVFTTPGKHAFLVKLTPAGRKLLRHGKGLKLTSKVVFTPPGGKPVTVVRTFKLKK